VLVVSKSTLSVPASVPATTAKSVSVKKACPQRHAFFIAAGLMLAAVWGLPAHADDCRLQGEAQTVRVRKVIDGDTVVLTDGRHVRLIGINTPELAHQASKGSRGNSAEPLSTQAQQALAQRVMRRPVKLQLGTLAVDHYGRTLGRLFDAEGNSIAAALLREGYGFPVIKAPDFRYVACVNEAAQLARRQKLGVWREAYFQPRDAQRIQHSDTGFRRVSGIVERVEVNRKQLWIELRGQVVIKVAGKSVRRFDLVRVQSSVGRRIEVSGWLVARKSGRNAKKKAYKPYLMQVDDPALLVPAA